MLRARTPSVRCPAPDTGRRAARFVSDSRSRPSGAAPTPGRTVDSPTGGPQDGTPHHLADLVARAAHRTPDQAAIVDVTSDITLTWAQFDAAVSAEATRLRAAGAGAGERVLVRLGNGAAFC